MLLYMPSDASVCGVAYSDTATAVWHFVALNVTLCHTVWPHSDTVSGHCSAHTLRRCITLSDIVGQFWC